MTSPFYESNGITIYHGDCREVMPELEPVEAVVTDPPYGLQFMGKAWDHGVPGPLFWFAVLDAMKPGAHLLAFGGTRTFHRLACAIEDAGLELRDCVMWVYGQGFPKSLDVSKAIDKAAGAKREVVGRRKPVGGYSSFPHDDDDWKHDKERALEITRPATEAAKRWDGWGTALKPAWEPIILARKALEGTVAENVLKHGTGALNIDESRISTPDDTSKAPSPRRSSVYAQDKTTKEMLHGGTGTKGIGRWPANLIHDGSDEVLGLFPAETGTSRGGSRGRAGVGFGMGSVDEPQGYGDSGSAARFFKACAFNVTPKNSVVGEAASRFKYCAKASNDDRGHVHGDALPLFGEAELDDKNTHPTVKPTTLMAYLCRLVASKAGAILDPFMGSGSTLLAAQTLGFKAIGIELEERYCEIAARRLKP